MEGASWPVFTNAEGEACLREAELPRFQGVTHREGGIDEGEVYAGTAWPLALALTQVCGRQKDLEIDGEQGEAAICRERSQAQWGVSHTCQVVGNRIGREQELQSWCKAQSSLWSKGLGWAVCPGLLPPVSPPLSWTWGLSASESCSSVSSALRCLTGLTLSSFRSQLKYPSSGRCPK